MLRFLARGLLAVLLLAAPAAHADDISNGSWSTTDGSNTAAPPNGWPAGMFPNQVEPSARSGMGGVKRWWERANAGLNTTGSAGAYILTPTNVSYPTAYTQGEIYCAKANFTSVGNDTLNVNGLGAKPLYNNLARIGAGSIASGQQFCGAYDGALNSGSGGFQVFLSGPIGPIWKYTSGSQSLSTSTHANINISTSVYDPSSICSVSTHLCTPNVAGYYLVGCKVRVDASSGSFSTGTIAEADVYKNGASVDLNLTSAQMNLAGSITTGFSQVSTIVQVNGTTDTLACSAYGDGASGQTIVNGTFWGALIHP